MVSEEAARDLSRVDASYLKFCIRANILFKLFSAARIDGVREHQLLISIALDALAVRVETHGAARLPCTFKNLLPRRVI